MNQSYINNTKNRTSKTFLFKHYKSYLINSKNFYENDSNIIFNLKNGLIFKKTDNKNNSNIPIITIGTESINLGKFYRMYGNEIYDGSLELKLRKSLIIGKLNFYILISEENNFIENIYVEEESKLFSDFIRSKKLDDFDEALSHKSKNNVNNLWKNNFLDSDEITNEMSEDFFVEKNIKDTKNIKNSFIKISKKDFDQDNPGTLVNEETGKDIKEENLKELLISECIEKKNKFALFQLFYIFLNYFQNHQFEIFDEFLSILEENQIQFLMEIYKFDDKNLILYKYFLILMDSYILFHKNNQVFYYYFK